jgi:hypothetical protein
MAETRKGKKFVVVAEYSRKKGSKKVRIGQHDRSTPRTSKGKGSA